MNDTRHLFWFIIGFTFTGILLLLTSCKTASVKSEACINYCPPDKWSTRR